MIIIHPRINDQRMRVVTGLTSSEQFFTLPQPVSPSFFTFFYLLFFSPPLNFHFLEQRFFDSIANVICFVCCFLQFTHLERVMHCYSWQGRFMVSGLPAQLLLVSGFLPLLMWRKSGVKCWKIWDYNRTLQSRNLCN